MGEEGEPEPIGRVLHSHSLTVGGALQASTAVMHHLPYWTGGEIGLEKTVTYFEVQS